MTCGTSSPEHRGSRGQAGAKADFRPRLPPLRPPPLSPHLAFSSSPGVPGSLRIFPESPRRILCAAAPPQLSGPSLFSASPASEPRPCASLCALFFPPRAVPPTSHALVASFRLGPRLSCLPFPLAPRFYRRPLLCPMFLAARFFVDCWRGARGKGGAEADGENGERRGLSFCDRLCLSRVFPAPRTVASLAPVAPSIPAASPPPRTFPFPRPLFFASCPRPV